jgi:hypothetical protein
LNGVAQRRSSDHVDPGLGNKTEVKEALTNGTGGMVAVNPGAATGFNVLEHATIFTAFAFSFSVPGHETSFTSLFFVRRQL